MFWKIVEKLYLSRQKKLAVRRRQEEIKRLDKDRQTFLYQLNLLYSFAAFINRSLPNSRSRKKFWSDVGRNRRPAEEVIEGLIEKYKKEFAKGATK